MSQHTSLKGASVAAKHRNVLKRHERIRALQEAEKWGERKSAYNLPKHRMIKLKVKKTKSAVQEEAQGAAGAGPVAAATPSQKGAAAQKSGQAEKAQAKTKA